MCHSAAPLNIEVLFHQRDPLSPVVICCAATFAFQDGGQLRVQQLESSRTTIAICHLPQLVD